MTVDTGKPESPDGRRIAVIIGTCGYSEELLQDIDNERPDCVLYSWNPKVDGRIHVNPFQLEACVETFKNNKITHVIHAGAVSVNDINLILNDLGGEAERVKAANEKYLRSPVLFYEEYAKLLERAKIKAISPAGVFERYAPVDGVFGKVPADGMENLIRAAKRLKTVAEARCAVTMREVLSEPDETRIGYIPRTLVYEEIWQEDRSAEPEFVEIAIERKGTIAMLKALPRRIKPVRRLLLKVLPKRFPQFLDCPTINPETIALAAKKHIDVIAIDRDHGLIINRAATLDAAEAAGIVLLGF